MAWGWGVADDTTVRELVTVPIAGSAVRFRVSNLFGNEPLQVGAATVAQSAGKGAIVPASLRALTFGGAPSLTVPIGASAYTDPLTVPVTAGETFAVSLYVSGADLVTQHPWGNAPVSFFTANGGGNVTSYGGSAGWISSPFPRWVDAADVLTKSPPSIVVVGDSITDGFNATTNWTDVLQRRQDELPVADRRAIVNEGISANTLTAYVPNYSKVGGGLPGLQRIHSDALDQPGVGVVVLFLGTNDIWFGTPASELIDGYQQAIAMAHSAGVRIVAVTLLPRSSNPKEPWTPYEQQQLEIADQWILTSGKFDGVIDMAPAVADAYDGTCDPIAMYPPFDSGDHLHPDDAGQTAMGNSIDPTVLGLPRLPQVPPLVPAQRTPACDAQMPVPGASLPPASTAPTTTYAGFGGTTSTSAPLPKSSPTPPALAGGTTTSTTQSVNP
jgi:lysophospholipase L1-like esterase